MVAAQHPVQSTLKYAILIALCLVIAAPIVTAILGSIRTTGEFMTVPFGLPKTGIHWENYQGILESGAFWNSLRNSLIITLGVTGLNITLSSMLAFVFSRVNFRGRGLLFNILLIGLLFPLVVAIQAIIDALTKLGIDPKDIQNSNLSVYSTTNFNPETSSDQKGYNVSNTVHIIVRDVSQVEDVIDTAINAGATTLYGLSFDIQDRSALETQAREMAMQDAAARGAEYASLIKAQLGDVILINETQTGGFSPVALYGRGGGAMSQSAVVTPGQTDVHIQVTVSYQIVR